jgi:Domain of unknown function (DUF4145)
MIYRPVGFSRIDRGKEAYVTRQPMSILTTVCPHCTIDQPLSVKQVYVCRDDDVAVFAVCPRCDKPVAAVIEPGPDRTATAEWFSAAWPENFDLLTYSNWEIRYLFPKLQQKQAPEHTPADIARIFKQACSAQSRGELEAAAILFGKTLEVAIKQLDPEAKGTLKQRIDQMAQKSKIPNDVVTWATEIRIVRNDAAHQLEEPNLQDVAEIQEFTEAFLMFVFTMPKKIATRNSRKASKV